MFGKEKDKWKIDVDHKKLAEDLKEGKDFDVEEAIANLSDMMSLLLIALLDKDVILPLDLFKAKTKRDKIIIEAIKFKKDKLDKGC